jgi:SRSO17 transposase
MLPLAGKNVESISVGVDPLHAGARDQALAHFAAKADWSDEEVLCWVSRWMVPGMDLSGGRFRIIDDTGFPKTGNIR